MTCNLTRNFSFLEDLVAIKEVSLEIVQTDRKIFNSKLSYLKSNTITGNLK